MPLKFKLRQLEYFIAVADAGSIVAASKQLNVAAPSISTALTGLEEEFGVTFFIRHHAHGLSLTPGGRRFLAAARGVVDGATSLHDVANDIANQVRGPVSVGALITVAPYFIPELRRVYQSQHPDIEFAQYEENQANLIQMLRRADIDVALTYDLDIPGDIAFEPLTSLRPYVLVAADHPFADRDSISLSALAEEPLILLDLPISRDYFLSIFQAAGLKPLVFDRTPHISMVQALVANGIGYSLLNIPSGSAHAPDGRLLRFIEIEDAVRPLPLGLATIQSDRKSRILTTFEHLCRTLIPEKLA